MREKGERKVKREEVIHAVSEEQTEHGQGQLCASSNGRSLKFNLGNLEEEIETLQNQCESRLATQ